MRVPHRGADVAELDAVLVADILGGHPFREALEYQLDRDAAPTNGRFATIRRNHVCRLLAMPPRTCQDAPRIATSRRNQRGRLAARRAMILDTCALLFLVSGDRRLSRTVREQLGREPVRWFCAISSFEIALKHRQGKLDLPLAPLPWLRKLEQRYGLTELPLDSALCAAAAELPHYHRDPFDRFIIAAALQLRVSVVTIDPKFSQYGVEVVSGAGDDWRRGVVGS